MLDMVLWQKLITELLDFLILKLGEATVQSHQQPGKLDVKIELLLVLDIALHNSGEVSSPWADLWCWFGSFWCFRKYFICWPFSAWTGSIRILKTENNTGINAK